MADYKPRYGMCKDCAAWHCGIPTKDERAVCKRDPSRPVTYRDHGCWMFLDKKVFGPEAATPVEKPSRGRCPDCNAEMEYGGTIWNCDACGTVVED